MPKSSAPERRPTNHMTPASLPSLPIAEVADSFDLLEPGVPFHASGEIRLGEGFSDPAVAAGFNPPAETLTVRNFRLKDTYLDTACNLLIKDGRKIPETSYLLAPYAWDHAQVLYDQLIELDPDIEYVIGCNVDRNYFHWLIQAVPAIDWGLRSAKCKNVALMLPEMTPWQSASVELLGYRDVPRVPMVPWHHFHFHTVTYSEFLTATMPGGISLAAQATFQRLRSAASGMAVQDASIIYVARTDAPRRVAINEHELIEVLVAEGVHIVVPGNLTFAEQVALFGQANAVLGPHGAGLSNIVFCRPGTILYEMIPEHHPNPCFSRLAHGAGLHYWADMFPAHGEESGHDRTWRIDIGIVRERLRNISQRVAELSPTAVPVSRSKGAMEFLRMNQADISAAQNIPPPRSRPTQSRDCSADCCGGEVKAIST
jgi:hypothetical protein